MGNMILTILLVVLMVGGGILAAWALHLFRNQQRLQQKLTRTRTALKKIQSQTGPEGQNKAHRLHSYLNIMDTLINTIPNPIYYRNLDGVIQGCNPAFAGEVLGLARDRINGNAFGDLDGHTAAELASLLRIQEGRLGRQNGVHAFEAALPCADGHKHEFLFSIAAVYAGDQAVGSVGVMLDLTAKNQAARDRIQKDKFQGVLETAGAVCHELNQPLQIISGYAEMALAETRPGDGWHDLIHPMGDQVKRMAAITRKLQGITRYQTLAYDEKQRIVDLKGSARG
jgi:PAS domain S-box-containing protein